MPEYPPDVLKALADDLGRVHAAALLSHAALWATNIREGRAGQRADQPHQPNHVAPHPMASGSLARVALTEQRLVT